MSGRPLHLASVVANIYSVWYLELHEPLEAIASHFDVINRLMEHYVAKTGHDPVDREKLRDPSIRAEMGALVRRCRKEEQDATVLLGQLICRL